jgi:serine/threonine-protein kinase
VDVELHMLHANPDQTNQLTVHALFHPSHPTLLADRAWRHRCTQIFVELRSYLMGRSDS